MLFGWFKLPEKPNITPDTGALDRLGESYLSLRQTLGVLGILLPLSLIIFFFMDPKETELRTSISAYYYSGMRDVFVGSLIAIGLFLITYCGNTQGENIRASIAGGGAIGVAVFPTERQCVEAGESVFFSELCAATEQADYYFWHSSLNYPLSEGLFSISSLHFISAGFFLLFVAAIALVDFIKTSDTNVTDPKDKHVRNTLYRNCAITIFLCVFLIVVDAILSGFSDYTGWDSESWKPVFWLEAIAIWAFAAAWLQKGNSRDRARKLLFGEKKTKKAV